MTPTPGAVRRWARQLVLVEPYLTTARQGEGRTSTTPLYQGLGYRYRMVQEWLLFVRSAVMVERVGGNDVILPGGPRRFQARARPERRKHGT